MRLRELISEADDRELEKRIQDIIRRREMERQKYKQRKTRTDKPGFVSGFIKGKAQSDRFVQGVSRAWDRIAAHPLVKPR